ncbi:MAG: hypothetical protein AB8G11_00670 [Saprospiraceae bacterium]
MRIVGDIPNPYCKITIFKTTSRFSVKFEQGNFEQTFKFRVGDAINNLNDVKTIVTEDFINQVLAHFDAMGEIKKQAFNHYMKDFLDEFETII